LDSANQLRGVIVTDQGHIYACKQRITDVSMALVAYFLHLSR
jgi:hypothetical protein